VGISRVGGSPTQRLAKRRKRAPTKAEKELDHIPTTVNDGILKGKFQREWSFAGKWILDFFFYENRLGIEVDGSYHPSSQQKQKDLEKAKSCEEFNVTLIRVTNSEVFGDREALLSKLREGYRQANQLSGHKRRQDADSYMRMICQREGINVEELKSGSRRGEVSRIRSGLALWLVEDRGIPLAEAARQLGVSTSAVSKMIGRRKSNST
jgi:very-short-patch-repair endonuclease